MTPTDNRTDERSFLNRRQFAARGLAVAGAVGLAPSILIHGTEPSSGKRKLKLGLIGCGGRGAWIGKLCLQHGGFEIHALADYFPEVADKAGNDLNTDKARRFSGLSGYKKVLESGIEAIALETLPCFFPEMMKAAVEAGVHIYMAKPIAVDVPGTLEVEAAGKRAKDKKLTVLVDYQIPTEPHNIEVVKQIHAGEIGKPVGIDSRYFGGAWADPPYAETIENRLQGLIWCNDSALGGSHHVNACLHTISGVLWVMKKRPISASGFSHIARQNPHGDSHDMLALSFEFDDGVVWSHAARHLNNLHPFESGALIHGTTGYAQINYDGKAMLKGRESAYNGTVSNLYEAGATRNIATFHQLVLDGNCENTTLPRAIDDTLTTIMGREAGVRRAKVTLAQILQENKRLEANLKGLKS